MAKLSAVLGAKGVSIMALVRQPNHLAEMSL